eukprot:CAMPEP_0185255952 /NCGR_PEP_ID=MMETSP1359-20130426/5020_1 /TAXON_ID=552665 /ORGANISM="Bigelowiella longifila, Strain CCMP242" /LENGTH=133 /DNA_ID=CAMNT_0027840213 /DNA_START=223 /DNA_END=624 /DNA_ORIENTATION=-
MPASITLHITTPEDTVMSISAIPGEFLLQALERSDLNDVWDGGACGGSCSCSTCRVILSNELVNIAGEPEEIELDMLETAADQEETEESKNEYLRNARLACQVEIFPEMDGASIVLPESTTNMLEVPLWMRMR